MGNYIQNNVIKTIAILREKKPFHGAPLKITKQTHFAVTLTETDKYKEIFVFRCG